MWKYMISYGKTKILALLLLLLLLFSFSARGFAMTTEGTPQFMTVRMELWNALNQELKLQGNELTALQQQFQKLKRPSAQLSEQLKQAKAQLEQSQKELQSAKADLMQLRKDKDELATLLKQLKGSIDKERRTYRRQIWQNRFWFLIGGAAIGYIAHK